MRGREMSLSFSKRISGAMSSKGKQLFERGRKDRRIRRRGLAMEVEGPAGLGFPAEIKAKHRLV